MENTLNTLSELLKASPLAKSCTRCGVEKKIEEFGTVVNRKRWRFLGACRSCETARIRAWMVRVGYTERKRAYNAKRYQDPKVYARQRYTARLWRDANRESNRAKAGVKNTQRKADAIAYKGGACSGCGYSTYAGSLDFHHIDPQNKRGRSSTWLRWKDWSKVKAELDICVMLCANCHREFHGGVRSIPCARMVSEPKWGRKKKEIPAARLEFEEVDFE